MSNVIYGRLINSLQLQEGIGKASGKPWKKKEYVLETVENYPKKVCFQFFGDKVDQYPLEVGQFYNVSFDIESREHEGRWFTSINAYRAELAAAPTAMPAQPVAAPQPYPQQPQVQAQPPQPQYQQQAVGTVPPQPQFAAPQQPAAPAGYTQPAPMPSAPEEDLPF